MSIVALLISNITSSSLLYNYSNSAMKKDLTSDSNLIVSKAKSLRVKTGQREKLNSDYGVWFITKDDQNLVYAACVSDDYPQRIIFGLFQKMQVSVKQKCKGSQVSKGINKLKREFDELCQKYKDGGADKVRQAQFAVKELKDQLHVGIGKILQNQDNLNTMNQRAVLMKNYAKQFEKGSQEVQKKMFWHKWKVFILIGLFIASLLIITGIVVYLHAH